MKKQTLKVLSTCIMLMLSADAVFAKAAAPSVEKASFPLGNISNMIVYTPRTHPELPWAKMTADALADSLTNDVKANVIIHNGAETINRNIKDTSSLTTLAASATGVCYQYDQGYK